MEDYEIKSAINLILYASGYSLPFEEFTVEQSRKFTRCFAPTELIISTILDSHFYEQPKYGNAILKQQLSGRLNFDRDVTDEIYKLIDFSTKEKIPLIKFPPHKLFNENFIGNKCLTDSRNPKLRFIRFVTDVNPSLDYKNIPMSNLLVNFLAHETGHALDYCSDLRAMLKSDRFKYEREVRAWENALTILNSLSIKNNDIELQKNLTLERYKTKYKIV